MATRFYLPETGVPSVSPGYDSWTRDTHMADPPRVTAVTTKIGSTMTATAQNYTVGEDSLESQIKRQYVSKPLAAQTIAAQNWKTQIISRSASESTNMYGAISIRSWYGSTFQTLQAIKVDSTLLNPGAAAYRNYMMSGTTSAVTVASGDRLIIEIGASGDPASGWNHSVYFYFGDDNASDLPENETGTDLYNPWIEFANTIVFYTLSGFFMFF